MGRASPKTDAVATAIGMFEGGKFTVAEIAELCGGKMNAVSATISYMKKKGLVQQVPGWPTYWMATELKPQAVSLSKEPVPASLEIIKEFFEWLIEDYSRLQSENEELRRTNREDKLYLERLYAKAREAKLIHLKAQREVEGD